MNKTTIEHVLQEHFKDGEWWWEIERHHQGGKVTYILERAKQWQYEKTN